MKLEIMIDPECEHCGALQPYDIVFDDGTTWCLYCAQYQDEFKENITEDKLKEAKITSFKKKLEFYESEISYCNTQLRKLTSK